MKSQPVIKEISTAAFTATLYFDFFNKRLRIDEYRGNVEELIGAIRNIVQEERFTKVIFHSRPEHWQQLLSQGFELEAIFSGFFNGTDNYTMAFYTDDARRTSNVWMKENEILARVIIKGKQPETKTAPSHYHFRKATLSDSSNLANLYGSVFKVYPTPMDHEEYVKKVMNGGTIFYIVECNNEIVSAASADINKQFNHAELTDCATLSEHRKYGLMKKLLIKLEDELRKEKIYCSFSIARALSFGMNAAFYQLDYTYRGRLTNNCYIYEKLEDMNVWVKDLSKKYQ
ncbi:putative beta-lysine N-acetyltransferase [Halalkalibacter alkalisediminis]|uniref:Beta-lysine N-acetyltransferase n=1 Tax=Halalkalibacter alkalisediminis TaxID=935616 RepID=A0ABV6NGT6_9BACI|nr:putative beta-lysine N-acetyltransferase [Halalkalibacter alkalisediminis]